MASNGLIVDPAQYGPSLAVAPPAPSAVSESNPLGLTAAAPGYLPPALRPAQRDPDINWSGDSSGNVGPRLAQPTLTPDQLNAITKSQVDWGNMDAAYWKPRLQDPTPILLGALGVAAAPFALGALGLGGAAGAAGAGAGAGATAAGAGLGATAAGVGAGALGAGALGGATVSELVVSAAASGLSIPAIAAAVGIPAASVGAILSNSGGSNALAGSQGNDTLGVQPTTTVSPVDVIASPPATGLTPAEIAAGVAGVGGLGALAAGGGGGGGTPAALGDYTGAGVEPGVPAASGSNASLGDLSLGNGTPASSLAEAVKSGNPTSVVDWVKANPLQAAQLGLLAAGALTSGKPGSGSTAGVSGAGTMDSLNPVFRASLPAPTMSPRVQTPAPSGINWNRYAIDYPAQSFFSNVPQSGPPQFAVMTRPQTQQNAADRLGYADIAALRKKFAGSGYSVKGPG